MAKDPKIIILDEATSSIDPESERLIQNAISKVLAKRTAIIIAHRLSTIEQCDEILVMEMGEIVEKGNHVELMNNKAHYYELNKPKSKEKITELFMTLL